MRLLVACPECRRQYEAGDHGFGTRFHCLCGAVVEVPHGKPHDAAVVRCSACGAPRQGKAMACGFCGSDFTLHERDLHTICPACMARVSNRARFCHSCAEALLPAGQAGVATDYACPACGTKHHLSSRRLGQPGIGVLECPRCAGLWLSKEEFQILLERARSSAPPPALAQEMRSSAVGDGRSGPAQRAVYRPCPICSKLMHRQNFGRRSGLIIDSCKAHGLWFDAHELDGALRWVRGGGEAAALRLQREGERERERAERFRRQIEPVELDQSRSFGAPTSLLDLLSWLVSAIFPP